MGSKYENIISNRLKKAIDYIKKGEKDVVLSNVTTPLSYFLTQRLLDDTVVYVAENVYKATRCYEALSRLMGSDNICLYIISEIVATEVDAASIEFEYERLNTISSIIKKEKKIIVTHIAAIAKKVLPLKVFQDNLIELEVGNNYKINNIISRLVKLGYRREPTCVNVGVFSVRGEILDIYAIGCDNPVRIDFFDIEIERIRKFDKATQMTIKKTEVDKIAIFPFTELIYNSEKTVENIKNDMKNTSFDIESDLRSIENYQKGQKLSKYLEYMNPENTTFLNYIENKTVVLPFEERSRDALQRTKEELEYFISTQKEDLGLKYSYFVDYETAIASNKRIFLDRFNKDNSFDMKGYEIISYNNNINLLLDDIQKTNKQVVITAGKKETIHILSQILKNSNIDFSEEVIDKTKISLITNKNSISLGIDNLMIIDESSIYSKMNLKNTRFKSTYENTVVISDIDDIQKGDYIVHYNYGIGLYRGLKVMKKGDIINDYIDIHFSNMNLYIPVASINMLEKYTVTEGKVPKLTHIGTGEWERKKAKVKARLNDIARELVLLQAYRENKKGFVYSKDDESQHLFEEEFEYVETKDQLQAIKDIKNDMEKGKIIERLVCGDVGYGKTEVAIRIAMKTVLNGKQVAFLAPTTILTRQHYYTFKERLEKYGVNVELINRLVTPKDKKRIVEEVKQGVVDVLVGTHAILSDKIRYKDLGLLIIDEEQRFGVVHKEKIKQYKNNVNVITLSATPIPRTLQLALLGAKQMSLIETPPKNRYPVQTYVLKQSDAIIRQAIYNEIGRGGQVFYMHNRVKDLNLVYIRITKLVPEARVVIAHGQLDKKELEDNIASFIDGEYDVLLCTSIIETGIDMPNTNTLIVENADKLGLSQMYQIRGRVGRSNRVSYAYFMYNMFDVITENGRKRMEAIKEFTSLGSGYKIATRDLAIRGAGDFLGRKQSGYINDIGMDLYIKMLDDSIKEIEGIETVEKNVEINMLDISKHIEDSYVSDEEVKIYIHKKIASIKTKKEKKEVIAELTDRFGKVTKDMLIYIEKQYLEALIDKFDIEKVEENNFNVKITFSRQSTLNIIPKKMMEKVYQGGKDFSLQYSNKKYIVRLIKLITKTSWITQMIKFLESLEK